MTMTLTEGAISMLSTSKLQPTDVKPVLQVVDVRIVQLQYSSAEGGGENKERFRLVLSDGTYHQQAMLATQRNELIRSRQLQKGSIVQLTEFVRTTIRDRIILIVIDLDVILPNCDLIGDAKLFPITPQALNVSMQSKPPVASLSRTSSNISTKLTQGAILMLSSGKSQLTGIKPVLQVLDIKIVHTQGVEGEKDERYRLLLSDGSFHLQAMLVTQLNDLVRSQQLQKGSIVQLNESVCATIRDRIIIVIIDLVVLGKCNIIGDAKQCPPISPIDHPITTTMGSPKSSTGSSLGENN